MELLIAVDDNDQVIGYSPKEDIQRKGFNYRCIQVFLFNAKEELLICRRPEEKKKFAGQFAASAMGHVRKGEDYEQAAIREMKQELGVNARIRKAIKFSVIDGNNKVFQEVWYGALAEDIEPDKTEIAESRYVNLDDLRQAMAVNPENFATPFIEAVKAFVEQKEKGFPQEEEKKEEQAGLDEF